MEIEHGTISGYCGGCRCEPCRQLWKTYQHNRRAAKKMRRRVCRHERWVNAGNGRAKATRVQICSDCGKSRRVPKERIVR